jgi:hypothetical protein
MLDHGDSATMLGTPDQSVSIDEAEDLLMAPPQHCDGNGDLPGI